VNPALSEKSTARIHPDASWKAMLESAAGEVFQIMVGTLIKPVVSPPEQQGEISAMVGMAGAICAVFRIRCSQDTASSVATKMLRRQGDNSQICDAMGEICNMVAGNFKNKITGLADGCMLSVPTVVVGDDFNVYSPASHGLLEVSFEYEGKPIWVTLEISS
jgi:chemotaxis protein CheX